MEPVEQKSAEQKPADRKFDPFHPEMPQIPGVNQPRAQRSRLSRDMDWQRLLQIGGAAALLVLIIASIAWWARSKPHSADAPASATDVTNPSMPEAPVPKVLEPVRDGPTVAGTVEELSKPWAAKKFTFVKPITRENIDAMVIRLPGGALWAFSLQGPDGRCSLAFVTDLAKLASQYGFHATHPMVVSPCDGTVYDPLKVGALGGNTWVRGEIVQGSSLRPPISIDIKVSGRSVIADSIE